jgi:hypothetical protein
MGGKHGTARQGRLIGTWPTTDEGGRVDQLFHVGAGEGDAEQVAVVVIDDPAGPAGVAVGRTGCIRLHVETTNTSAAGSAHTRSDSSLPVGLR